MKQGRGLALGLVGLLVVGLGGLVVWLAKQEEAPSQVPVEAKPRPSEPTTPRAAATPPSTSTTPSPAPRPTPRLAPALEQQREASARMRSELRASLANEGVAARPSAPASDDADDEQPTLDKEYIRERMREDLVPVAVECYESVLAEQPDAGGTIVMNFAILGDPEVGGVVDEAAVDTVKSDFDNAFLRECMTESLMAINFDAPPEGGRVEVSYPFVFEPGEDE